MSIRHLPEWKQPREKAKLYGIRSLSSAELLALLFRTGTKDRNAVDTAEELLEKAGGVGGISSMKHAELLQIRGIGEVKALQIEAAFELNRRVALEQSRHVDVVENPESLISWLKAEIGAEMQEEFLAVYLDSRHRIIHYEILFRGTINAAPVSAREVFRQAILLNSTSVMLVHNHPSGSVLPSDADLQVTERMVKAGRLFGIDVLDHLIVNDKDFFSFHRQGILPMEDNRSK